MSMTLAEWLKLQDAQIGDYFFYNNTAAKITEVIRENDTMIYSFELFGSDEYFDTRDRDTETVGPETQLYRMVNGELQRINRPYITCTTCGRSVQIEKADGWCCYFENGNYCPDCEAKRKAQAVIQESLTTEKIKISPCPRCGSRKIRAWEVSYFSDARHDYQLFVCQDCYYENDSDAWRNDSNEYTNITDKYEVE